MKKFRSLCPCSRLARSGATNSLKDLLPSWRSSISTILPTRILPPSIWSTLGVCFELERLMSHIAKPSPIFSSKCIWTLRKTFPSTSTGTIPSLPSRCFWYLKICPNTNSLLSKAYLRRYAMSYPKTIRIKSSHRKAKTNSTNSSYLLCGIISKPILKWTISSVQYLVNSWKLKSKTTCHFLKAPSFSMSGSIKRLFMWVLMNP